MKDTIPLYTAPPQRTWQGLTDEERIEVGHALPQNKPLNLLEYAKAIEAKLKEKSSWRWLTEQDRRELWTDGHSDYAIDAVESKLKEKNT